MTWVSTLAVLALGLANLVGATPAHAARAASGHYVDCSRTRNGTGSSAAPWNSLTAVNAATFRPGDQLLFARGSRCTGTLAPRGSGNQGSPIVVDAYGTGALPVIDGNGAPDAVRLSNQQYWEIRDLDVTNAADPGSNRRGVHITGSGAGTLSHIVISGLDIHDIMGDDTKDVGGSAGILVDVPDASHTTHFNDVTITGNTLTHVEREGIFIASNGTAADTFHTNVTISGNTVTQAGGDGIVLVHTAGALVDHNTVAGFNMTSPSYNAGIWAYGADDTVFQYNDVSGGHGHNDSMAFDVDDFTDGTVFQYNYSHDNDGGFVLLCSGGDTDSYVRNAVVRYNISQNDSYRGVEDCRGSIDSAKIYNNTIYVKPGADMAVIRENDDANTRNVEFSNNVVYNAGSPSDAYFSTAAATGYVLTDNTLYNTQTAPGSGTQTGDPLLLDAGSAIGIGAGAGGYRLCAGSPALASGTPIAGNGGKDFFGNPLPTGDPNRGAYAGAGADPCGSPDLIPDSSFESGDLTAWATRNARAASDPNAHTGKNDLQLSAGAGDYATAEYTVTGLQPNTTYVYAGWVRSGDTATYLGVKDYGAGQVASSTAAASWTDLWNTFTTGSANSSATVFCYLPSAGSAACDDLSLTVAPPGTDLALGRPATSSADAAPSASAVNAVDGNRSTHWSSPRSARQWLQVDLSSLEPVSRVRLSWGTAYGKAYRVESSVDGKKWTTIYSTRRGTRGTQDLTGLSGAGRYVRVYGTKPGTRWGYSLSSIQVFSH